MTYRFDDRRIGTLTSLIRYIKKDFHELARVLPAASAKRQPIVWYRGVPDRDLPLVPTLYRQGVDIPVTDEVHLLNRFKQNAHQFLAERPQGEWEWMLLGRHHGLPSRLLDWTEGLLTGAFFAAGGFDKEHTDADGALWCLLPTVLNEIATNGTVRSDVLPMFSDEAIPSSPDVFLDIYKASAIRTSPVQGLAPAAAISIRTNKRIQAQSGVFTVHHINRATLDQWGDGSQLWRFIIPANKKATIQQELRRAGVNPLTLFPDLDNVAKEAERGY